MYRIHCRRCPRALCQWNNCVFASSILLGEQLLLSLGNTHSSHAYQSLSLASWALKSMVRADQGLIGRDPIFYPNYSCRYQQRQVTFLSWPLGFFPLSPLSTNHASCLPFPIILTISAISCPPYSYTEPSIHLFSLL